MTVMTRSAPVSPLGSEFHNFLYAPLDDDRNGMMLSVLSALARLDVDPWEEAARLSQPSEENATRELASLLAAVPKGLASRPDPETIAPRLIALLPHRVDIRNPSPGRLSGVGSVRHSPAVTYLISYMLFIALMLIAQWLMAGRQAMPLQGANAPATESAADFPHTPGAGQ